MTEVPGSDWLAGQDDKAALKQAPALKGLTRWHRKAGVVTPRVHAFPAGARGLHRERSPRARGRPRACAGCRSRRLPDEALPNVMRKVIAHGLASRIGRTLARC